jgi:hypothetical protein
VIDTTRALFAPIGLTITAEGASTES